MFPSISCRSLIAALLLAAPALFHAAPSFAQLPPPPLPVPEQRQHILLPPTQGATVLSTWINAMANRVAAQGDYEESVAIARRHHAAAFEHELDNAVKYVETFFKRREINKAMRFAEKPLDRREKQDAVMERRVLDFPADVKRGDVTEELNWLLDRLSTALLSGSLVTPEGPAGHLAPDQVDHIRVSDSGKRGQKLIFRLGGAHALETDWPHLLLAPELAPLREEFANERNIAQHQALTEGKAEYATLSNLRKRVIDLMLAFDHLHPREERVADPTFYLEYKESERYLKSLLLQVIRFAKTNDARIFNGSYGFNGRTTTELVEHMTRSGLRFAEPEPGDEAAYNFLFQQLREVYSRVYRG